MECFVNTLLETADLSWITKRLVRQKYCENVGRELTHEEKLDVNRLVQNFIDRLVHEQKSSPDKVPVEVQVSPCNKENTTECIKSSTKIKQMTGNVTAIVKPLSPRKTPQKNLSLSVKPVRQSPRNKGNRLLSPRKPVPAKVKRIVSPRIKIDEVRSAVLDSDGENVSELSDDDSSYDEIQQEIKENERKQLKDSLECLKAARQKKIQLSTEKKKKFRTLDSRFTSIERRRNKGAQSTSVLKLQNDWKSVHEDALSSDSVVMLSDIEAEPNRIVTFPKKSKRKITVNGNKHKKLTSSGLESPLTNELHTPVKCGNQLSPKRNYFSSDTGSLDLNKTPKKYLDKPVKEKQSVVGKSETKIGRRNPNKRKANVLSDSEDTDFAIIDNKRRKCKKVHAIVLSSESDDTDSSDVSSDNSPRKKNTNNNRVIARPGGAEARSIYSLSSESTSSDEEIINLKGTRRKFAREKKASSLSDTPKSSKKEETLTKSTMKNNGPTNKKIVKVTIDSDIDSEDEPLSVTRRKNRENLSNNLLLMNDSKQRMLERRQCSAKENRDQDQNEMSNCVQISDVSSVNEEPAENQDRPLESEDSSDSGLDSDGSEDIPLARLNSSSDKNKENRLKKAKDNIKQSQKRQNSSSTGPSKKVDLRKQGMTRDGESQLKQLRKICRASGMFIRNDVDLKSCDTNKQKIQKLQMLLKDAGMIGRPSMKKAEEVRLKKEAAELNADNIISKESSRGQRKVDSKYSRRRKASPMRHDRRSATPSPRKPAKPHFISLIGIVDSEGSDEA